MSRYRLLPTAVQEATLLGHCAHARYVWNLAVEQHAHWHRSAKGTPENPGRHVRQKAGLNRGILRSGWGLLVRRMEQKAPGRVERMSPVFTSQRCSACGQVDSKSRESQAVFQCTACGYASHADVNAARNIAAGHAVTARGGDGVTRPVNREPQLLSSLTGREQLESSAFGRRRMPTQPTLWLASVREQTSTIAEIQSCPLPAAHRAVLVP
jgi:ribosomal protein L37AE/L43A